MKFSKKSIIIYIENKKGEDIIDFEKTIEELNKAEQVIQAALDEVCIGQPCENCCLNGRNICDLSLKPLIKVLEEQVKIKIGDKVKVIKPGKSYTTYSEWFEYYNIPVKYAAQYCYDHAPNCDTIGKVVAIHKHQNSDDILILFQTYSERIFLISQSGVVRVND